jgi:hypothetical protein
MGVHRKTVQRWRKSGLPIEPDGSFNVDRIAAWRGEKPMKRSAGSAGNPDGRFGDAPADVSELAYWETEFKKFRAKIHELDFLQKRGQLVERDKVEQLLVDRASYFKKTLLQMSRRLSLKIANKDAQICQKIIDDFVYELLENYSRD